MKKIVIIYGLIAGAIVGAMLLITMPLYEKGSLDFENGELLGYSTMVVALSLIFFGIKSFRDNHQKGQITFWKGLQVGLLITLIGSLVYATVWEFSYQNMSQEYIDKMYDHYYDAKKAAGATDADLQELKAQFEMYDQNFLLRFCLTAFLEMFPVGLVISLICAGLLRKKEFLPSQETIVSN
jgi:4-hydroxybenzoate polyprenyltransferase